jgi:hypothetical protein
MLRPRRVLATILACAAWAAATLSCDAGRETPPTETATSVPPPIPSTTAPETAAVSGWDASAGPVLLVAADRPDAAIVVFPELQGEHAAAELHFDTTALRGAMATLVARAGTSSIAVIGEHTKPGEDEECVGWPMVRVTSTSTPGGVPTPWSIGLIGTRLTAVPLDSVASLSPLDSATLVAEVARLASTVPVRTDATRLRGLPFSVQDVRRFEIASGTAVIIARVVRGVHQEANPLEERTLLIAERDSAEQPERRASYVVAFHERTVGREETLEGTEILAVLAPRNVRRPMLVVARESESGMRYAILERLEARRWRVKWTSALMQC